MTATATQTTLTAAEARRMVEAMRAVIERRITIVPVFDGAIWSASVEVRGDGINRRRILRTVSATAATPIEAIEHLVAKLDGAHRETADFEGGWS